eukprot:g5142.t1
MPTESEKTAAALMIEFISRDVGTGRLARLLESGADPNIPHDGRGVENRVYALGLAAYLGCTDMVSLLLQYGAAVNKRRRGGETALQCAAAEGHRSIVAQLLAAGADVHHAAGPAKRTALHMAAKRDDGQIVKMLVEAGARQDAGDDEGHFPIHLAADNGKVPALKELVRAGSDPEWRSDHGQTSLAIACLSGRTKAVRYLLESCGVSGGRADVNGYTPLAAASQGGYLACVKLLLKRGVADLGANAYRDALTGVAMAGDVRMLRELAGVDGGAHVPGAKTSKRMTALHFAAGYCHPRAVALLLAFGADERAADVSGETPFDVIDTMRAAHIRHGVGCRVIRRMLTRGPAYRALSWRWPASVQPPGGTVSSTEVAVVSPAEAAAAEAVTAEVAVEDDGIDAEWEDSEHVFDEAFELATAAVREGPRFTVFRRPGSGDGSLVDERAAFVARLVRYSQKTQK